MVIPEKNQFPEICRNIERILGYSGAAGKVRLNYVVTADNAAELDDFKNLAARWQVASAVRPVTIDFDELNDKRAPDDDGSVDNALDDTIIPCYNSYIQPYIESNGDVLICCDGQARPMGNLRERNFREIWQDGESIRLCWAAIRMKKPLFDMCPGCANANLHSRMFHGYYGKLPFFRH